MNSVGRYFATSFSYWAKTPGLPLYSVAATSLLTSGPTGAGIPVTSVVTMPCPLGYWPCVQPPQVPSCHPQADVPFLHTEISEVTWLNSPDCRLIEMPADRAADCQFSIITAKFGSPLG